MKHKFEKNPYGRNYLLSDKEFYISYNPNTTEDHMSGMFTDLGNTIGMNVKDGEETALYHEKNDKWMILEGDFRKEYEKAFPSYRECKKVYTKNKKEHRSNWSTE